MITGCENSVKFPCILFWRMGYRSARFILHPIWIRVDSNKVFSVFEVVMFCSDLDDITRQLIFSILFIVVSTFRSITSKKMNPILIDLVVLLYDTLRLCYGVFVWHVNPIFWHFWAFSTQCYTPCLSLNVGFYPSKTYIFDYVELSNSNYPRFVCLLWIFHMNELPRPLNQVWRQFMILWKMYNIVVGIQWYKLNSSFVFCVCFEGFANNNHRWNKKEERWLGKYCRVGHPVSFYIWFEKSALFWQKEVHDKSALR